MMEGKQAGDPGLAAEACVGGVGMLLTCLPGMPTWLALAWFLRCWVKREISPEKAASILSRALWVRLLHSSREGGTGSYRADKAAQETVAPGRG